MESLELESHKEEPTKEIQTNQLLISQDVPSNKGISGEPSALPRVGDEYQVQVPDTATAYHSQVKMAPDIPIMWTPHASEGNSFLLPCVRAPSAWSESEREAFLLGIYVFGKRLNLVHQFLEGDSKTMGDVLSYYYGTFYKSDWYKKYKLKRCVLGSRIFTGWRQDQILSRLMESVPKEFHDVLQEVFKAYNEERSSFEDFIFALRRVAGVHFLVQAISIGKGKHDLTKVRSDPTRGRNQTQTHLEMPVGKEWSSLPLEEVIRFLTSGFRLGKARSNDLFWEAVWPRLLVQGWISVQQKSHALVFLSPGIDSFPREDLIKGIHYFDSITDLLSKVASDPNLISLPDNSTNNDKLNNKNSNSYLRPKLRNSESDLLKFTVIDTSVVERDGVPCKLRALRSFPHDTFTTTHSVIDKPEGDRSASEMSGLADSLNESISVPKYEQVEINAPETNSLEDPKLKSKKRVYVDDSTTLSQRRRLGLSKVKTEACENDQKAPHCINELSFENHFLEAETEAKEVSQASQPSVDLNLPDLTSPSEVNNEKEGTDSNNSRRHGTRNRPPTTKALESLALGFIGTTKRNEKEMKRGSNRLTKRAHKSVETVISGSQEKVPMPGRVSPCTCSEDLIDQV